jgi:hypothetical protein
MHFIGPHPEKKKIKYKRMLPGKAQASEKPPSLRELGR